MRRIPLRAIALLAASTALLGGCIGDTLSSYNPFNKKEVRLAGERRAVLENDLGEQAVGLPAIGGAQGIDWPQPGGNAANAPSHASFSGGAAPAWRAKVGGGRGARSSALPIVENGRVFAYDVGGTVSAFTAAGARLWSTSVATERGRPTGGGVASSGDRVYAATGFGEVVALEAGSGKKLWTYKLGEPARSAPTAAGGKVYVVTSRNVLHAIKAADGAEAWTYSGIPEREGLVSTASPAVVGSIVVVPYSSGEVIAFNAETGEPKWTDAVVRSSRTMAVSGFRDIAASPIVYDGTVYATGVSGRTIAVGLSSGERLWEADFGSTSTPAISGNALFAIDLSDRMVAIDRKTGKVFWSTQLPTVRKKRFYSVWSGPTLAGNALWAVSNDGRLVAVDPVTGALKAEKKLGGPADLKPVAANGKLYLLARDGSLTALQ